VEWSNADIEMYWVPYENEVAASECISATCTSGLYYGGMCAYQVGSFKNSKTFSTEARSTSEQAYEMQDKTSQEQKCWLSMIGNVALASPQRLVARGHVKNKAQGKIKVTDSYYVLG
jgi:hypothetical protein